MSKPHREEIMWPAISVCGEKHRKVVEQRDELLAACEEAYKHYDRASEILRVAIKKAKDE